MTAQHETPRTIRVYDTLSRQKRPLEPIKPCEISMYVCGVTVYDLTHIGHARTFVFFDVVQRFLRHLGYTVRFVRNHTDVDDKIIARAAEQGEDPLALSRRFIEALEQDMSALGVQRADIEPKVSDHIDDIIDMVRSLIARDFAYASQGDVYYRVNRFEGYGKLSGRKLEDMEAGRSGRVDDADASLKEHPFDFALWKAAKPGELSWESPWGQGRPGWHIECSAMSLHHLGEQFDIHGGGADLTFPHHENEIAQSEACTGCSPYARQWMHVAMLNIDGEKMSKSLGNFWTTRDVLQQQHPEAIRLFMFSTYYRNPINYSTDALKDATRRVVYLYEAMARAEDALARAEVGVDDAPPKAGWEGERGPVVEGFMGALEDALSDDFNTALSLSLLHEQARHLNELTQSKKRPKPEVVRTLLGLHQNLRRGGALLGLLQQPAREALESLRDLTAAAIQLDVAQVEALIKARADARDARDWARADALRDELLALRVEIMDAPEGTTWRIDYERLT